MEKDLASISSHQGNKEIKPSSSKKSIKKNKGISKSDLEKKHKEPMDMENMQKVIKQLTNEIIYLNKNKGEGKKPFKPFLKKKIDFPSQIASTLGINLEYYAMENYYHTHHANHSERTCPEFIFSFIAMMTPLEPPKKEENNKKQEDEDDQREDEEYGEGEEAPSHLNLIWDAQEINDDDDDDIMEEACVGNDYKIHSKGPPKSNDSPSTMKTNTRKNSIEIYTFK